MYFVKLYLGAVRFDNRTSESLDAIPEQSMFTNPIFHVNKGLEGDSESSCAVKECKSWEVSDC